MAGRIRKEDIDTLRERADVLAVVGDHTRLSRAGQRHKGLCPFHSEKTPSFTVDPAAGLFYCFGCGAGGDIYDFVMRLEGLEFPEAVEHLARRTGFTLRYENLSAGAKRALGERSRLVAVTTAALEHFRATLYADVGRPARDYLKSRGFDRDDAERFQLGYAPNEWDALSRHLTVEQRFAPEDVERAGLAQRKPRGLQDRFRGRLIFPVHDASGDVIGFGGRILPDVDYGDFDPPKYYNSPETRLYRKTRVLYGLLQGRAEIVRSGRVLVCEGYTDVMALHQAGLANAVATCGTAVSAEHLRVIARYAREVVLAFDADEAGVRAAERAWEEARTLDASADGAALLLRVLALPVGTDPADVVRQDGVAALQSALEEAPAVVPFVLRHTLAQHDTGDAVAREAAVRAALEVLGREPDPDLRRAYARSEVADRVGVAYGFVAETARRLGVDLDTHPGIADVAPRRDQAGGGVARLTRASARLERDVLRVALQQPDLLPDEWYELTADDFTHPTAQAVHAAIAAAGGAGVALTAVIEAAADDGVRRVLRELALEDDPVMADPERAPLTTALRIGTLLARRLERQAGRLRDELGRVNAVTDPDRARDLSRRLDEVQARVRRLQTVDR